MPAGGAFGRDEPGLAKAPAMQGGAFTRDEPVWAEAVSEAILAKARCAGGPGGAIICQGCGTGSGGGGGVSSGEPVRPRRILFFFDTARDFARSFARASAAAVPGGGGRVRARRSAVRASPGALAQRTEEARRRHDPGRDAEADWAEAVPEPASSVNDGDAEADWAEAIAPAKQKEATKLERPGAWA